MNYINQYFTRTEKVLWSVSVLTILLTSLLFDGNSMMTITSIIGVTSLIFNAKGNPFGQLLMIIFSVLYGIISFKQAYYGEVITYLGMTAPMALFALVSWLKHPFNGQASQVEVATLTQKEQWLMLVYTTITTIVFFFILKYLNTSFLWISTLSVTTSFLAVYLTYKRSSAYALAYAANDLVLIVIWTLATIKDPSYLGVTICFIVFFINDIYGFISWKQMKTDQAELSLSY